MKTSPVLCATMLLAGLLAIGLADEPAKRTSEIGPIDFSAIDRTIARLPELVSDEPRYALFLFGVDGESKVWALLDKSEEKAAAFDRLYLDLNANGDLTEPGECFAGEAYAGSSIRFSIPELTDPSTKAVHTDFTLTWSPKTETRAESNRIKMKWRGKEVTMGPYGPSRETYQVFASTPAQAPVFVPGYDRPFQFQHWTSDKFVRGKSREFKVFVGNRGSRTGAFFCVDDTFLKTEDSPQATFLYSDIKGKERRFDVKLTERC